MCQLIAKPAGKTIPYEALEKCWDKNPDGAGFAYTEVLKDGKKEMYMIKGFMSFKDFWTAYQKYEHFDCLIHFRIGTHGSKCKDNCHPFIVGKGIVMGHNGVLREWVPDKKDDRSDTRVFAEEYIKPILADIDRPELFLDTLQFMLEPYIGYNKIVFMTVDGFTIVNEEKGDWDDGIWYSNGVATRPGYGYKPPKTVVEKITYETTKGGWYEITSGPGFLRRTFHKFTQNSNSNDEHWFPMCEADMAEDAMIDAAIKNQTEKPDYRVTLAIAKAELYEANKLSMADWFDVLCDLSIPEFEKFAKVFSEGDPDTLASLEKDRKEAIQSKIEANKRKNPRGGGGVKVVNGVTLPAWMKDFGMVNDLSNTGSDDEDFKDRAYWIGGRLLSRSAAQKLHLITMVPIPKDNGMWIPEYDSQHVICGWKNVQADSYDNVIKLLPENNNKVCRPNNEEVLGVQ